MLSPWQAFALTIVALFLKMFATAFVQGVARMKSKTFAYPEDAAAFGGTAGAADHPLAERGQRALRNDLENIPMFSFLALAYVQLGCWETGVHVYFPIFVLARIGHTLTFLRPTQPLRNRFYLVGVLVCLVLSGHIVAMVLAG
ncbi:MAPEG family protein [Enhygromyxa salina]|uniref:Microsomal glutathione S-transferase 1 n=1 Tax=Enhygromyxa salina TaxID=215803 RepID=A0A2S9XTT2_9BACT|nr:MAPEG family protein [Enhygromyxa salina]PRP96244.1 MAPEG family protein [Enhygromyxa salina]